MSDTRIVVSSDPFDYLDALREAWADEELQIEPLAGAPTYRLALAQGRCLLSGIHGEDSLFRPLPANTTVAALSYLNGRLEVWRPEAEDLRERWDETIDSSEAEELCARLLKFRMDVWAASLAIDRVFLAAPTVELCHLLDEFNNLVGNFDDILEQQSDVLCTLTGTHLLENWRLWLAPEHRQSLPWWLDGRLEALARKLAHDAASPLSVLHSAGLANSAPFPQRVPIFPWPREGVLAAADTAADATLPGEAVSWISPTGLYRAEVRLPARLTPEEDVAWRRMNFTRIADDAPATELQGWVVQAGETSATIDDKGRIEARPVDLRFVESLVLRHNEQQEQWLLSRKEPDSCRP